jgi:hypothetical protein
MRPIVIQKEIDKAIAEEYVELLENNKDDKLLQLLISWSKDGTEVSDVDLEFLMTELGEDAQ